MSKEKLIPEKNKSKNVHNQPNPSMEAYETSFSRIVNEASNLNQFLADCFEAGYNVHITNSPQSNRAITELTPPEKKGA